MNSNSQPPFGRVATAMITPFNDDESINFAEVEKITEHLITHGTNTIVVAGTTGESPTLSHEEEFELFQTVIKVASDQAKVIAGTGSNSTKTTIYSTKAAEDIGVDAAMVVCPYYNKPSQDGLIAHFTAVAESTELPIMIYNIPGRCGINMEPETTLELSKVKNIICIKEASGDINQIKKVSEITPDDFFVYSGDDNLTLDILKVGGCGVVSVASHLVGDEIQEMVQAYFNGNESEASKINIELAELFQTLFITSNPVPLKYALSLKGFNTLKVRLPLVETNDEQKKLIENCLKQLTKA